MKVFIPSAKDANPYLEEIMHYSTCNFIFGNFKHYKPEYEIVNIHWPESLFDWFEPTTEELAVLEQEIKKWKRTSRLVYTLHDENHLFGRKENFNKLFELIENNADVFIHLGEFSKRKMAKKYPKAIHKIIVHPLYLKSFEIFNKADARKKLQINPAALVVIAPGKIRSVNERNLILKAFKTINKKNKILLSNNMLPFHIQRDFRGRVRIKRFFDFNNYKKKLMERKYVPPHYIFNFQFTGTKELSTMFSAADIVFIPRIENLNSGNVFLGLTFKKIIVGPAIGNIKNELLEFDFPVYNPHSFRSVKKAIKSGIKILQEDKKIYTQKKLKPFHPEVVAAKMDDFFKNLSKNYT